MSAITICDICGEVIDRSEKMHMRVSDERIDMRGIAGRPLSRKALDALTEETRRRVEEVRQFSRGYDMHAACYVARIQPAIAAAMRQDGES